MINPNCTSEEKEEAEGKVSHTVNQVSSYKPDILSCLCKLNNCAKIKKCENVFRQGLGDRSEEEADQQEGRQDKHHAGEHFGWSEGIQGLCAKGHVHGGHRHALEVA